MEYAVERTETKQLCKTICEIIRPVCLSSFVVIRETLSKAEGGGGASGTGQGTLEVIG